MLEANCLEVKAAEAGTPQCCPAFPETEVD